ncbi:MAG: hypothetical protein JXA10_17430 [Anaerolineae bacterium]|nr:hypothetical protein [Anaerolineae bacterium]
MIRRLLSLLLILLALLILTACTPKTALRFSNETECGPATITLTNTETGHLADYTVDEGKEIEVELDPNVKYHYEVTYPRQPDYKQCDAKTVTTMLEKGTTLNIALESVRDPALDQTPTATPE